MVCRAELRFINRMAGLVENGAQQNGELVNLFKRQLARMCMANKKCDKKTRTFSKLASNNDTTLVINVAIRPKRGQFPQAQYPFEIVHMDFIELNKVGQCKYCLVLIDAFSKW